MALIFWGALLPVALILGWYILHRPVRQFAEELQIDQACDLFRKQREWLEAHFLTALSQVEPLERLRWDDAHWHDEILWARDRQSHAFLALIGVHFDDLTDAELGDPHPRHATALFEYRRGRWIAEGKRLDEVSPDQAVLPNHPFEPVVLLNPRRTS